MRCDPVWLAVAGEVLAQEQQSFKSLLGRGFEIKNVVFAKGEATENREVFVVTLQREKSVAVWYPMGLSLQPFMTR